MATRTNYNKGKNKYYRTTLVIGRDENGNYIRKEFYGDSKREAEEKKRNYMMMLESGINPDLGAETLQNAIHTWLWEIEKNSGKKPATFERNEGIYRNYIKESELANLFVKDIKALTIQKYYNKLSETKTYSQIEHLNKFLKKFFNYAYNEGYINRNPCRGTSIPLPKTESEVEIFTNDELSRIMKALEGNRIRILTKFALGTGARMGELLALTWDDIDLNKMTINIDKSATFQKIYENEIEWKYIRNISLPKNYSSKRVIPFPSHLLNDLKEQKKNNNEDRLKAGTLYDTQLNLVFPTYLGGIDDRMNIGKMHRLVLKKAKVRQRKFHTYRHTFVSLMQSADVPLEVISKLIGHSTYKTTVDTYLHISIDDANKAINNMNNIFKIL